MQRGSILLITTVMVFVAIGVQGTSHLSFANNTQVSITRDGCGTTKLCVEVPYKCDPAGKDNCLFTSMNASQPLAPNGVERGFELSGNSAGYIAVGLTMNATQGTTILFICGQNSSKSDNEKFFFQTMQRDNSNNELTELERSVTEIRGVVKDNLIQCEFNIPVVNTTFIIILGSGEVNGAVLGNLKDTTTTESGASGALHPHAVLLLLSVLTLSVLKTD